MTNIFLSTCHETLQKPRGLKIVKPNIRCGQSQGLRKASKIENLKRNSEGLNEAQTYQPAAKSLKQNQNQRPTKVYAPETTEKQVT